MKLKGTAETTLKLAPNRQLFMRPMSIGARDCLMGMIEWGCSKLTLFNHNPNNLMTRFGEKFDQIRFEEAEQIWDTEQYVKIISGTPGDKKNPGLKVKTDEDVLGAMCLDVLFSDQWAHNNSIKRRNRVGDITQVSEIYKWLIQNFMTADFTQTDLGKMAEMGRLVTLDVVKREAQKIGDPDKRHIAYLYTIIRNVSSREEVAQYKSDIKDRQNDQKLAQLGSLLVDSENKLAMRPDPDRVKRWEQEREWLDALRDINNK